MTGDISHYGAKTVARAVLPREKIEIVTAYFIACSHPAGNIKALDLKTVSRQKIFLNFAGQRQ